jgi:hypothetical protein
MTSLIGVAGACGGVAPILAYAASAAALADSAAAATLPSSPSEARGHRARAGCRADAPDRRHGADVARELAVAGRQARRIGSVRAGRGVRLRQADYAVGCCPVLVHRRRLHLLGARFHVRAGLYPGAEMQKEQLPDREHDARSEAAEGSALADQDRAARGLISRTSPTRSVSSPRPAGCAARASSSASTPGSCSPTDGPSRSMPSTPRSSRDCLPSPNKGIPTRAVLRTRSRRCEFIRNEPIERANTFASTYDLKRTSRTGVEVAVAPQTRLRPAPDGVKTTTDGDNE